MAESKNIFDLGTSKINEIKAEFLSSKQSEAYLRSQKSRIISDISLLKEENASEIKQIDEQVAALLEKKKEIKKTFDEELLYLQERDRNVDVAHKKAVDRQNFIQRKLKRLLAFLENDAESQINDSDCETDDETTGNCEEGARKELTEGADVSSRESVENLETSDDCANPKVQEALQERIFAVGEDDGTEEEGARKELTECADASSRDSVENLEISHDCANAEVQEALQERIFEVGEEDGTEKGKDEEVIKGSTTCAKGDVVDGNSALEAPQDCANDQVDAALKQSIFGVGEEEGTGEGKDEGVIEGSTACAEGHVEESNCALEAPKDCANSEVDEELQQRIFGVGGEEVTEKGGDVAVSEESTVCVDRDDADSALEAQQDCANTDVDDALEKMISEVCGVEGTGNGGDAEASEGLIDGVVRDDVDRALEAQQDCANAEVDDALEKMISEVCGAEGTGEAGDVETSKGSTKCVHGDDVNRASEARQDCANVAVDEALEVRKMALEVQDDRDKSDVNGTLQTISIESTIENRRQVETDKSEGKGNDINGECSAEEKRVDGSEKDVGLAKSKHDDGGKRSKTVEEERQNRKQLVTAINAVIEQMGSKSSQRPTVEENLERAFRNEKTIEEKASGKSVDVGEITSLGEVNEADAAAHKECAVAATSILDDHGAPKCVSQEKCTSQSPSRSRSRSNSNSLFGSSSNSRSQSPSSRGSRSSSRSSVGENSESDDSGESANCGSDDNESSQKSVVVKKSPKALTENTNVKSVTEFGENMGENQKQRDEGSKANQVPTPNPQPKINHAYKGLALLAQAKRDREKHVAGSKRGLPEKKYRVEPDIEEGIGIRVQNLFPTPPHPGSGSNPLVEKAQDLRNEMTKEIENAEKKEKEKRKEEEKQKEEEIRKKNEIEKERKKRRLEEVANTLERDRMNEEKKKEERRKFDEKQRLLKEEKARAITNKQLTMSQFCDGKNTTEKEKKRDKNSCGYDGRMEKYHADQRKFEAEGNNEKKRKSSKEEERYKDGGERDENKKPKVDEKVRQRGENDGQVTRDVRGWENSDVELQRKQQVAKAGQDAPPSRFSKMQRKSKRMRLSLFPNEGQKLLGETCCYCFSCCDTKISNLTCHHRDNVCTFFKDPKLAPNWVKTILLNGITHYVCTLCPNFFPVSDNIEYVVHRLLYHPESKVKCLICENMVNLGEHRDHLIDHFNKFLTSAVLECSVCAKVLPVGPFLDHISDYHKKGPKNKLSRAVISSFLRKKAKPPMMKYFSVIALIYLRNHEL